MNTCYDILSVQSRVPSQGPRGGTLTFRGLEQVGVDSVDLGVPRGRAPKVPEKARRVSLDFIRTRPEVLPRGPGGGTLTFRGSGQVRVYSFDPKVLRRTGRGGLGCEQAYWIPYSKLYNYI